MRHDHRPPLPALLRAALLALCVCLLAPAQAWAHPHAFVDARVDIVFDADGLAGVRQRWVMDEMTSFAVLDLIEEDGDGELSAAEAAAIEEQSFGSLRNFHYFTAIINQGEPFRVDWATDFSVELHGMELVYSFFVPCHVAATATAKEVLVAVFDNSFYTYVAYSQEGDSGIDPTKDPLFANRSAQAAPGDFERFSQAVGLSGYQGGIRLDGPLEDFTIHAEVVDAQELAYFHDQIVPQGFRIRFSKP